MTPEKPVIAVDAMGGDFGPSVVVPGVIDSARLHNFTVILVGQQDKIETALKDCDTSNVDYSIVHASEVALTGEKPSDILRRKKDASIQVACRLVKNGTADGVLSAGHSGASVACGMFIMGRIPGVERPAFASVMPTESTPTIIADVGANVDCRPLHLFQFGLMAEAYARDILDVERPKIALLSIGEEEGKGNSLVKETFELFKMSQCIQFCGNVEGRDLFTGEYDVVVCDGFVGNVALKLSEGLATSMARMLKKELLSSSWLAKVGTFLAQGAFKRFARFVDYAEYGGALLLGLQGVFIVCHGKSCIKAITNGAAMAAMFARKRTNETLIANLAANEELTRFSKAIK